MESDPKTTATTSQSISNYKTTSAFQQLRTNKYQRQLQTDARNQVGPLKIFAHQLSALVFTRAIILGPFERMKIILQVKHLAQFVNASDRPKNFLDLSHKIGLNQGLVAYYRGTSALIYRLSINYGIKFMLYETVFQHLKAKDKQKPPLMNSMAAASVTALLTTALTYPLDLAQGRMAADMSKKPNIVVDKSIRKSKTRLYPSVRECLAKTQEDSGVAVSRKFLNLYKGFKIAMLAQVPYTVILLSSFETFHKLFDSQNTKYNSKKDDIPFITKYFTRFGSATLSLLLAQTLCYPLDTVKRRMQLNGSIGHKNIYRGDFDCFKKMYAQEGLRGLYSGFSANLCRCVPLVILQFMMFQNFRFISQKKRE